jgi:heme-degrading monooxygenase HmoA
MCRLRQASFCLNGSAVREYDVLLASMIARHWRGWTTPQNADAYEALLSGKVLPDLRGIQGYCGGYVFRSDGPAESEFVVIKLFDSLEAVKAFAGADYSTPVFEPEARALLSRIDPLARHYEVRANTV